MTDIILGMGEVGETLFDLLKNRNFECVGIDADASKSKNYTENSMIKNAEYLHICLPGELSKFVEITLDWISKFKDLKIVLVHSTVKPGTTKKIQEKSIVPVLFSPVRGVHRRFSEDIKKYTKFIASDNEQINSEIKLELKNKLGNLIELSTCVSAAKLTIVSTLFFDKIS